MGARDQKAVDEESHQALLGDREIPQSSHEVSNRERVTRSLLLVTLLVNCYTFWYRSSVPYEGLELRHNRPKGDWAHRAADVAETLASYDCSGHGSVFLDTVQTGNGDVVCECHECFSGPACAEYVPDCEARVDSGDPVMYEAFWKQNADIATLVTPPWYRIGYAEGTSVDSNAMPGLEAQIKAVHQLVGNAVIKDKSLVISSGSTPMLFAIAQALSMNFPGKSSLVSLTPFYELYKRQAELFGNDKYSWVGDATTFGSTVGKNVLEFVTSPNNPTFTPREQILNGSKAIFDFAYYWPSMAPVNHAHDEDIMVFTLSKITGLAGSRLGWAFFRDPELAATVQMVVGTNALTISHDAQARGFQVLKAINGVYSKDNGPVPMGLSPARYAAEGRVFHYGRAVLQARYEWLVEIIDRSTRFSMLKLDPEYSHYFGQIVPPAPAYTWIYCNRDEDDDCYNLFLNAGIRTYPGVNYGTTNRFVRFSMLKRDSDYQQLEKYLSVLIAG